MKDKQRKIIAVFNVHWGILRAFCSKLQGRDKHREASLILLSDCLIPHTLSLPLQTQDLISSNGFLSLYSAILSYNV